MFRIGQGYDVHRLVEGRALILGGVTIPYCMGLLGHSDADALLHAIIDALFGAAGLGDIGRHFPDSDQEFRAVDSRKLLRITRVKIDQAGWDIVNLDATLIAQEPKLAAHINAICANIAEDLKLDVKNINVKAKTNEYLGYLGNKEGIEARTVVLLQSKN